MNSLKHEDYLSVTKQGVWMFQGKPLDTDTVIKLRAQAKEFLKSDLYRILRGEASHQVFDKVVNHASTAEDLLAARMLAFWAEGVIHPKLIELSK